MSCRVGQVWKLNRRLQRLAVMSACALGAAGCAGEPVTATTGGDPGAKRIRAAALAAARVWRQPAVPVSEADLRRNPAGSEGFSPDSDLTCRFTQKKVGGTTPKFYCETDAGTVLKIKYGAGNPELHAEVAASRLLTALGFWADRMYVVRSVQCGGCPTFPFHALRCLEHTRLHSACFPRGINHNAIVQFPVAVVEQRLAGHVIESVQDEGWAWYELDRIDPAQGGSSRDEVDALRLMAVFLAHWDNKSPNQRLVCLPGSKLTDGTCDNPVAIIQDLGATFGPTKLDLLNWRQGRIWKEASACTVTMKHLPWGGATFPDWTITEPGRLLLLGLLEQLSDNQLRDLFEGSRVTTYDQLNAESRNAASWVRAFKDRVKQIRDGGPCPSTAP